VDMDFTGCNSRSPPKIRSGIDGVSHWELKVSDVNDNCVIKSKQCYAKNGDVKITFFNIKSKTMMQRFMGNSI